MDPGTRPRARSKLEEGIGDRTKRRLQHSSITGDRRRHVNSTDLLQRSRRDSLLTKLPLMEETVFKEESRLPIELLGLCSGENLEGAVGSTVQLDDEGWPWIAYSVLARCWKSMTQPFDWLSGRSRARPENSSDQHKAPSLLFTIKRHLPCSVAPFGFQISTILSRSQCSTGA
jgi:hypothetical protein